MNFIKSSAGVVEVTSVDYNTSDGFGSKLVENNTNANSRKMIQNNKKMLLLGSDCSSDNITAFTMAFTAAVKILVPVITILLLLIIMMITVPLHLLLLLILLILYQDL